MESPVQGRPNRDTGLPPGVEVGPLDKRFVAFLINLSVPVIVSVALIFLLPSSTGALRLTLGVIGAVITIGWLVLIWYTLAVRAASPGLRAMKLQVVGFLDGRPIGLGRVFIRAMVFWALYITGIGLLIMLIMMLRHPRKQGWHDLAVTSVMIKERLLAPPVQPARAVGATAETPSAQAGSMSQPQPTSVRAASPQNYAPGEGYGPASPVPPGPLTPPPGMAPANSGAPYAAAVPPGGSASPYGGNAYATPYPGAPYGPSPYSASPTSQPSAGELPSPRQQPSPRSRNSPGSPSHAPAREDLPEYVMPAGDFSDQSAMPSSSPYVQDWSILLDDGRRITLEGLVLLGRNPQPKAGEEDAQLIKISDESRTVSKSHLAVGVDAGGVYVVDRGSTNGSTVSTTNGMSARCRAGEMVRVGDGAIVSIGDHWIEITRGH
jgi:uncharacterized RDD family membrane protein YckC